MKPMSIWTEGNCCAVENIFILMSESERVLSAIELRSR